MVDLPLVLYACWIAVLAVVSFQAHSLCVDSVLHLLVYDWATRFSATIRKPGKAALASFTALIYYVLYGGVHMIQECLVHALTHGHEEIEVAPSRGAPHRVTAVWLSIIGVLTWSMASKAADGRYLRLIATHGVCAGIVGIWAPVLAAAVQVVAVVRFAAPLLAEHLRFLLEGTPERLLFALNRLETPHMQIRVRARDMALHQVCADVRVSPDHASAHGAAAAAIPITQLHDRLKLELEKVVGRASVTIAVA